MRLDLEDDPAVVGAADQLQTDTGAIVIALYRLWRWANRHTVDGRLGVSRSAVDAKVGLSGFADAMIAVGWCEADEGGRVCVRNFDRWNSKGAKRRLEAARRMAARRSGGTDVRPPLPECSPDVRTRANAERTECAPTNENENERESINHRASVREVADSLIRGWSLWAGRELTTASRRACADMAESIVAVPPKPGVDAATFARLLIDNVTGHAGYVNDRQAEKYLRGVIERCRRDGCLPGEFAEHPAPKGGGSRRVERDWNAIIGTEAGA